MVIAAVPKRYLENVFFKVIEGNSSFCARSAEEAVSELLRGIARDRIPRSRDRSLCYLDEIDSLNDRLDVCDTSSDRTNRPKKITVDVYNLRKLTRNGASLILLLKNWRKIFAPNKHNWLPFMSNIMRKARNFQSIYSTFFLIYYGIFQSVSMYH